MQQADLEEGGGEGGEREGEGGRGAAAVGAGRPVGAVRVEGEGGAEAAVQLDGDRLEEVRGCNTKFLFYRMRPGDTYLSFSAISNSTLMTQGSF